MSYFAGCRDPMEYVVKFNKYVLRPNKHTFSMQIIFVAIIWRMSRSHGIRHKITVYLIMTQNSDIMHY